LASHVAGLVQFPETIEIKLPGADEVNEISSIAAGGFVTVLPSDFQLKIKRCVVPGVPIATIVAVFQAAELKL